MQYKISVLVFVRNADGKLLLIRRTKAPNVGLWSPIGGKLEMATGESPHECAARETFEETGLKVDTADLHLFCMAAEKAYEGANHWLMFLFDCRKPIGALPAAIDEGKFAFYSREEIETLPVPETDRDGLWALYDENRDGFVALRVDCKPGQPLDWVVEQRIPSPPEHEPATTVPTLTDQR